MKVIDYSELYRPLKNEIENAMNNKKEKEKVIVVLGYYYSVETHAKRKRPQVKKEIEDLGYRVKYIDSDSMEVTKWKLKY